MRRDPAVTVAARMMIVHVVSVIPDVVGAGPQYQNEKTEEAGNANLLPSPLPGHLGQLCLTAVRADHALR